VFFRFADHGTVRARHKIAGFPTPAQLIDASPFEEYAGVSANGAMELALIHLLLARPVREFFGRTGNQSTS